MDDVDDESSVALVVAKVMGDDGDNVAGFVVVVGDDVPSPVVTITVTATVLASVTAANVNKTNLRTIADFDESRIFSPDPKLKLPNRVPKQKLADEHR